MCRCFRWIEKQNMKDWNLTENEKKVYYKILTITGLSNVFDVSMNKNENIKERKLTENKQKVITKP